ncbi:6367_t:CDS:1, partial [Acaulospora colombiana]
LPNEILQVIFDYATKFPGLVYHPWKNYRSTSEWRISSVTRQSIPLVCRQWHANGLPFLYQHIALETYFQAMKLQKVLESLSQEDKVTRLGWIRGLEFLGVTHHEGVLPYWRMARKLIMDIPPGNIKTFSIDVLHITLSMENLQAMLSELGSDALNRVREHVEVLQLGYTEYSTSPMDILRGFSQPDDQVINFPKLHTLFFSMENRQGREALISEALNSLGDNLHQLRSMAFAWPREVSAVNSWLRLLQRARNITNIYISTCTFGDLLHRDFEGLLTALPNLSHLTFSLSFLTDSHPPWTSKFGVYHSKLETITILLESPIAYEIIHSSQPLSSKILYGELPQLKSIVIKGPYLSGCLDSSWTLAHGTREKWRAAIELCAAAGVQLVTLQNDAIHLWDERHGIDKEEATRLRKPKRKKSQDEENRDENASESPEEESGDDDLMTDTSDDSQWYQLETDSHRFSVEASSDEDSDDGPYRYVGQPDIEMVDSDSEVDLNSISDESEDPL